MNDEDRIELARLVDAEAADQPFLGKIAVAAVVLNRVRLPGFGGDNIHEIIHAKNQFESVGNGRFDAIKVPSKSALQAVDVAMGGFDPTEGATFFWNPRLVDKDNWVVQNTYLVWAKAQHVFGISSSFVRGRDK